MSNEEMNDEKEIKMCTPINKLINSEILFPYASHNFTPHIIKQCCLCKNKDVKSIREIVDDKIVITYYCKEHNPTELIYKKTSHFNDMLKTNNQSSYTDKQYKEDIIKWTTNMGKELVKEINTQNKCDKCNYKITSNKKYKQCKVCKSVSKLNYLEECYGLNYKYVMGKRRKTHKRMNDKRQGLNGKIF